MCASPNLAELNGTRRTPGLVAPEGFHAIRVEEARTAYLAEVENLCERLASDVRVLVQVVDAATLRRVTAHGQTARHRLRRQPAGRDVFARGPA